MAESVIIIGAGIIGICTALALQEKGFQVSVIDRDGPAEGTSFGNAGVISPWSCVPQAMPGVWKNVPKWLLDPDGPLSVKWSYAPRMMPWLLKFFQAGTLDRLPAIADAMLGVNRPSVEMYHQLLKGTGQGGLIKDCNYLHVYRNIDGANPEHLHWRLRQERGVPFEVIKGEEVREIEPDLSPEIKSAMLVKRQARVLNPGKLGKVLADKAKGLGVKFLRGTVAKIIPEADGAYEIATDEDNHNANWVVLAAGAWSARLLKPLGVHVPLEAERGYHMVFKDPGVSLNNSIMDADNKFVASSMEMGIRSAGTAEFAGLDAAPDYRRARVFERHTKDLLPNLNLGSTEEWMGVRPSLPDSVPVIGAVPGHPRIICAFGHGHLGLTGAPMTGRMVTSLVAEEPLNMDMTPYRLDRFSG